MVLKCSNSTLNSGATQRGIDRHYWLRRGNRQGWPEYNQINFYLTGEKDCFSSSSKQQQQDKTVPRIFHSIAEVFGIEEVTDLTKELPRPINQYRPTLGSLTLSLDKKKRWRLTDTIRDMISMSKSHYNDESVPSDISTSLLVRFEEMMSDNRVELRCRNGSVVKRIHPTWPSYFFRSEQPIVPELDNSNESSIKCTCPISTKKENTNTRHSRGIQRLNSLPDENVQNERRRKRKKRKRRAKKNCLNLNDDGDTGNYNKTLSTHEYVRSPKPSRMPRALGYKDFRLQIEIVGDLEGDSRSSTVKTQIKRWTIRPYNSPRVALCKGAGSTKGGKYGRRHFTYSDLMEEVQEAYYYHDCNMGKGDGRYFDDNDGDEFNFNDDDNSVSAFFNDHQIQTQQVKLISSSGGHELTPKTEEYSAVQKHGSFSSANIDLENTVTDMSDWFIV